MSLRSVTASLALCLLASSPGLAASPGAAPQASALQAKAPAADPDRVVNDPTLYNTGPDGQVTLAQVNETASVKHHSMAIDGKLVRFTAGPATWWSAAPTASPRRRSSTPPTPWTARRRTPGR